MGGRQTLTTSPTTMTDIFLSLGCVRHPKHLGVFVYINSCYPQSNFWCYRYYSLFIHKESTEWWGDLVNVTQLESGAGIPILLASSFLSFKKQNDNTWLQRVNSKREIWQIHWTIGRLHGTCSVMMTEFQRLWDMWGGQGLPSLCGWILLAHPQAS